MRFVLLCASLQLEEQEALLREDVTDEVVRYSGQLMLHKEVDAVKVGKPILILKSNPNLHPKPWVT